MRPTWKGNLKLALVLVPVSAYPAARQRLVTLNQLHDECKSRVRYVRQCPTCDRALEREEIVRGYEYEKDRYVLIGDDDMAGVQLPSTRTIDIVAFVEAAEINPLYYHGSFYVAPEGAVAAGPFHTIRRAMKESGRVAVAQVVINGRERLVALRPEDDVFVMSYLHYADEVRETADIDGLQEAPAPDDAETDMAARLIRSYAKPFAIDGFEDGYRRKLLEIVAARQRGEEVVTPPSAAPQRVVNLMDALKASLARIEGREDDGAPGAAAGGDQGQPEEDQAEPVRRRAAG